MQRSRAFSLLLLTSVLASAQGLPKLKPGFNLFSKAQDVELGKEAAEQVAKQYQIVRDPELAAYVSSIGRKLIAQPQADSASFAYSFTLVYDKSVNAFALPGGPTFVHTGLILDAENEAQLAGVLAHEISHVALRHGTHQATKAVGLELVAGLLGASVGGKGLLGQLTQAGIAFGANSVLLKYSRDAERQADLLGAQIMAGAGYNPIEMARFFEKLESEGGGRGPQFLSDHPNPGNRVQAVEDEIRYLPRTSYTGDSGQFARMQARVRALKGYSEPNRSGKLSGDASSGRPSKRVKQYPGRGFSLEYPENWQASPGQDSSSLTLAAPNAVLASQGGGSAIGYGAIGGFSTAGGRQADLREDTRQLIQQLLKSNTNMRVVEGSRSIRVGDQDALLTQLSSDSPFQGQSEADSLVTVARPEGLFYLVLIAPQSEVSAAKSAFDRILGSIRFGQ